ncbi:MAG: hypothetical protein WBA46_09940 [Thermomicrobiales bacterium]
MTNHRNDRGAFQQIELMVQREARERCPVGCCSLSVALEPCVHGVVPDLWHSSRITAFIPVIALRQVGDCIRAGTCATGVQR